MNSQEFVLSLMDLLYLDEEIIDQRLKSIMEKDKYTSKHLTSAIYLLQYKQLVNLQDQCDCTNDDECDFVAKLIRDINEENVNHVCEIVSITLGLNAETLINKSEHFLQQILSDIDVPVNKGDVSETLEQSTMLLYFKISDSILDTVIKKGEKLTLPFLELPVMSILHSSDEKLKIHFLTTSVPKLFQGISGFNILDKIWEHVKELKDNNLELTQKVLSLLSDYYLPVADSKGNVLFKSEIVKQFEFWNSILNGLLSTDPSIRKISIYLLKRAIDCVIALNKNICVKSHNRTIFIWDHENKKNLKLLWDNFFILLDSLEEKQSNIVLPSLQLFESLKSLENWLISAYNIGLKHDNTQVRLKCIQHRLTTRIKSQSEASVLLEALNDINLYDNIIECEDLKRKISTFISDKEVFVHIFTAIPFIKWSPVPFYHITSILSEINFQDCVSKVTNIPISQSIIDVLKVPCNNIVIRKAVFNNIAHFVRNCCNGLNWKDLLNVYCMIQTEVCLNNLFDPQISLIHKDFPVGTGKEDFFKVILQSHLHIEFGLLYLQNHPEDVLLFIELVLDKINTVQDMVNRQYSDKLDCLSDVIYLTQLHYKINESSSSVSDSVRVIMDGAFRTILYYIHSLLFNNSILSVDEISILSIGFHSMSVLVNEPEIKDIISQLYKTSMLFITDKDTVLETKVLSLYVIHCLHTNKTLVANYKQEMFSLKEIITLTEKFENKQSIGRLRNIFYEKVCEIAYQLLKDEESSKDIYLKEIVKFIDNVIECGGYGCLRFCLNIMNFILPSLLEHENLKYDVTQFINRIWNEIEELKSNNQYNPCIEEFVNLITQDCLLKRSAYNNVITLYCNKIIECGALRNAPLFYLVKNLNDKIITAYNGQIVYVLREILLYSPVPRKDQRIVENLVVDILQEAKYSSSKQQIGGHYNFQIQSISILILTKIKEKDILINLEFLIKKRIEEVFKNKQRYHGHSQAHRLLLIAVQHLLLILALKNGDSEKTINWCVELLRKLPHQPSVRICLEWYIALYFYIKNTILSEKFFEKLKSLPTTSQFMILFWIVKHKTLEDTITEEEYEFVMDFLLSHTMGQMFNIRLHAQYLATKLHEIHKTNSSKYSYTINVIEKTFVESAKDKNFVKLQQDYMVNNFDIVNDITPSFVYYFLPRYCEVNNNESVDLIYVREIMENINSNILSHDFFERRALIKRSDEDIFTYNIWDDTRSKIVDDTEIVGTLQKKYVPWKNMTEVNLYDASKKRESSSELVVVASLIDKLPNLGGMARTSEVFGVKTYVVDSLRHLQDKQFQGLSVSAERWIDMEEVRQGQPLKQYLLQKKIEGYSIVAAEQTSTSAKLQSFKFPKKTLLLLGHEKKGIPCDVLPMMDFCVEIPQKGFIRSLNVHVTAAIFIWEYARQNIL